MCRSDVLEAKFTIRDTIICLSRKTQSHSKFIIMCFVFQLLINFPADNPLFICKIKVKSKGKVSLHTSQVAHQAGAYPGFCSMKRLGVFLLPPGWDASPSQGYPQQ